MLYEQDKACKGIPPGEPPNLVINVILSIKYAILPIRCNLVKDFVVNQYGKIFDAMSFVETKSLPTPPRIFQTLLAGFDLITNHLSLIIFPIALDMFLWFGPHLSINRLIKDGFTQLSSIPDMGTADAAELIRLNQDIWSTLAERLNIFSFLRSYPVGISSVIVSTQPIHTPFYSPVVWEINSLTQLFFIGVLIMLFGVIFGALYFYFVALVTSTNTEIMCKSSADFFRMLFQVIILSIFWLGVIFAVSLPGICLLSVLSSSGLGDGMFGIYLAGGLMIWLIFPLLFSPHGIFLSKLTLGATIKTSVRLIRFTFPSTTLFFLLIFIISEGLNVLWRFPDERSWLTAVGVVGHGFITTALLAATFIYYQEANKWVDQMFQQLQKVVKKPI